MEWRGKCQTIPIYHLREPPAVPRSYDKEELWKLSLGMRRVALLESVRDVDTITSLIDQNPTLTRSYGILNEQLYQHVVPLPDGSRIWTRQTTHEPGGSSGSSNRLFDLIEFSGDELCDVLEATFLGALFFPHFLFSFPAVVTSIDTMEPNPPSELQSPTLPSRRTRSQAPSDWSVQEMLLLVSEVAEIESDFMKTLSSHQKWKIISDNCAGVGVPKSLNQCRRKWEQLQAEYTKIKDWESQSDIDSYWSLESKVKMELGLPLSLDEEVFRTIDNQVKGPEDEVEESVGMGVGSESESADSKLNLTHAKNSGMPIYGYAMFIFDNGFLLDGCSFYCVLE
ncbi:hypothetical protein GIB67_014194 [Kingdonia uniflora]|uniref:Myb-like domain-containing protein n=1 Tax=Kingdonia uniflora TaxID=39325 RepID=A0A7J7M1T3_9MAGN|nr:hypothetical protein GIB67_014194 [Kingdonia uniflora]